MTSNKSSEYQHNNIEIDNDTIIITDLKLNDATSNYANNSDGNSSFEINCFYHIPNCSQHTKAQMNMEVMCIVIDSTMYNGEDMRNFFHYNNNPIINNKNTNNISIFKNRSEVKSND